MQLDARHSCRNTWPVLLLIAAVVAMGATPAIADSAWPTLERPETRPSLPDGGSPNDTMKWTGLGLIRVYQTVISPLDGPSCQFRPTCSAYGMRAVRKHGFLKGVLMTGDRLERCNTYARLNHYSVEPDGYLSDPVGAFLP